MESETTHMRVLLTVQHQRRTVLFTLLMRGEYRKPVGVGLVQFDASTSQCNVGIWWNRVVLCVVYL